MENLGSPRENLGFPMENLAFPREILGFPIEILEKFGFPMGNVRNLDFQQIICGFQSTFWEIWCFQ